MCTVLLRIDPGGRWPLVLGAIRDEFVQRSWDPPARHWDPPFSHLLGGRDRRAGGTWLALDPVAPSVAALLNAGKREDPDGGEPRPTRGTLALRVLTEAGIPEDVTRYDRFHLLRASLDAVELWSWDSVELAHQRLEPGDHIIVNAGLDTDEDPLVPHFAPLLAAAPSDLEAWRALLVGDDLAPDDERARGVRTELEGHLYGTTSGSLLALSPTEVLYDFTATPEDAGSWAPVALEP